MTNLTPWRFNGVCERVVDGDTQDYRVRLFRDTERIFRVRLLGVNTPDSGTDGATWEDEKRATTFVRSLLFGEVGSKPAEDRAPRPIELQLSGKTDKYGREIGVVVIVGVGSLDHLIVGAEMGEYKEYAAHIAALVAGEESKV